MPDLDLTEQNDVLVGRRVVSIDGGHYATVLFQGKVGDTKGEWLGVEWDDSTRGKHAGTHEGVQYFQPKCSSPTSSSFIRLNKVDLGRDILAGTNERYGLVEGETAGVEQDTMINFKNEIGARFVEVVGFDKVNRAQCQLDKLRSISLTNMRINDEYVDLLANLPAVKDIDLSKNLISSWPKLAKLLSQVPIQVVNLSENRIPVPEQFPVESLFNIRHLVLGDMDYTWQDIEIIAGDLPNLEVLQVHSNGLSNVTVTEGKFPVLKEIDLDENLFTSWDPVDSLDTISSLERIRLNHNKIKTINITKEFKNLKSLQIISNLLEEWKYIGELDKLSNLTDLRLRHNPVLQREKESTSRAMIIALSSSVKILNGTEITKEERNWAELDYYKKHGLEYLKVVKLLDGAEKDEAMKVFSDEHRRYLDIVGKFGQPEEGELVIKENNIKSSLVSVKFRCPDLAGSADTVKKIPLSMTVAKLKALVGRLYKKVSGGNEIRLYVQSSKTPEQKDELDNDLRDIGFYSVEDGDFILVRWVLDTEL